LIKVLIFFIIFTLSAFSQTTITKVAPGYNLTDVAKSPTFNITRNEDDAARKLIALFRSLRQGHINNYSLKKAIRSVNKTNTFKPFKKWLASLKRISQINSASNGIEYCRILESSDFDYSMNYVLNKKLIELCHSYTLQQVTKSISSRKILSKKISGYLDNHFTYFLNSKNSKDLYNMIDKISSIKNVHQQLSENFTQQMIDLNLDTTPGLLRRIKIGPELTHYIQHKGLSSSQSQRIFYNEIRENINTMYDRYEEGDRKFDSDIYQLLTFTSNNKNYLPHVKTYKRLLGLGRFFMRRELYNEARSVFSYVMNSNDEETRLESTFQHLWTFINDNDYSNANKFIIRKDLLSNYKYLDSRLKFWISYVLMKNGDNSSAISYYKKLINEEPLSYYSIMATKNIQKIKNKIFNADNYYASELKKNSNQLLLSTKELSIDSRRALKRLKLWGKNDFRYFINAEYSGLINTSKSRSLNRNIAFDETYLRGNMAMISASLLGDVNNYIASFKILYNELAKKNISISKSMLNQLFPKPFFDKLKKNINPEIDPLIPLSLIRQESGFNPNARSRVGARGLMQLMPSTARTIERRVKSKQLYNPDRNLRIGGKYFAYLYDTYEGNLVYTLSAYNAGESRVKKWRKMYFKHDSILHNIENIPFNETRKYVKLIFRNIFFYKILMEGDKTVDSTKSNEIFDIVLGFKH
jgi:soluble lytic murein transglycosylase